MKIFVIHRSSSNSEAKAAVERAIRDAEVPAQVVTVNAGTIRDWRKRAIKGIALSELVVVFDGRACDGSGNTAWEIGQANKNGKPIFVLNSEEGVAKLANRIGDIYHFRSEFEGCFDGSESEENLLALHARMLETSEQLIQRRQLTNGFYTTLVGGIIGAVGFLFKEQMISTEQIWVLGLPAGFSALLCYSWSSLIDNYGKLNAGKFAVINRIEKQLSTKLFTAEWYALGNGKRPRKYRSFTQTERWVPKMLFLVSIAALVYSGTQAPWQSITKAFSETMSGVLDWLP